MENIISVDFGNTKTAFAHKSTEDLKRARFLFQSLQNRVLGGIGQFLMRKSVSMGLPVNGIIKATLYKQFIGGESLEDCTGLAKKLHDYGVYAILDYALEGKDNEEEIEQSLNEFYRNIEFAASYDAFPVTVFKPSAIGSNKVLEVLSSKDNYNEQEQMEYDKLKSRYNRLFKKAHEMDVPMMVDAEESWIQEVIDRLVMDMMELYNKEKPLAINTYQLYRTDRLERLKADHELARSKGVKFGAKLVRGAYLEKERKRAEKKGYPSPVHYTKQATDKDYDAAVKYCLDHIDEMFLMVASHNETSTLRAVEFMAEKDIPSNHPNVWFSQLYGMCDHISFNLAAEGFNVAKYVPYGDVQSVVPYLTRRAEENSGIAGQVTRELRLIKQELDRRKD